MIKLVPRTKKSPIISAIIPILAVGLTMIFGGILFWMLGKDPFETIRMIFWDPLMNETFADYARPQILVKAAPLVLIAIGLSFGFRANIWNIGAEGQFIMGAIFSGALGLTFYPQESSLLFPLMIVFGILGGVFWASWGVFWESWRVLGGSWGALGGSWAPLGASWMGLGGSWRHLGRS